jgi:hypothetical protein
METLNNDILLTITYNMFKNVIVFGKHMFLSQLLNESKQIFAKFEMANAFEEANGDKLLVNAKRAIHVTKAEI